MTRKGFVPFDRFRALRDPNDPRSLGSLAMPQPTARRELNHLLCDVYGLTKGKIAIVQQRRGLGTTKGTRGRK